MRDISGYHLRLRVRSPPYPNREATQTCISNILPISIHHKSLFKPRNRASQLQQQSQEERHFLTRLVARRLERRRGESDERVIVARGYAHISDAMLSPNHGATLKEEAPLSEGFFSAATCSVSSSMELLSPLGDQRLRQRG